jgi:hypothetical protein
VAHSIAAELHEVDVTRVLALGEDAIWNWLTWYDNRAKRVEAKAAEQERQSKRRR